VRCILFDLWTAIPLFDIDIEILLAETWAGDILRKMKEHHDAREAERLARDTSQNSTNVQKRREEKKRLKQEEHEKRLALKKERDRRWHEKQVK
jgi:hypothetical protein